VLVGETVNVGKGVADNTGVFDGRGVNVRRGVGDKVRVRKGRDGIGEAWDVFAGVRAVWQPAKISTSKIMKDETFLVITTSR
jgi:hypothetical protein